MENIINFLHQASKMKKAFRFSEAKEALRDSASDHSWRVSLMTFLLLDELKLDLDRNKVLEMAIIHDIVECIVGNTDYVLIVEGKGAKEQKEKEAIEKIKDILKNDKVFNLWCEYEKAESKEAKFIKTINRLETTLHLIEAGYEFFDQPDLIAKYPQKAVDDFPQLKEFFNVIKKELKKEFEKGGIPWKKEYD